MSEPFPVFEELVGHIKDNISLIDQGLDDGQLDVGQADQLGDISDELQGLLLSSRDLYEEFLDRSEGDWSALGAELIKLLQERIEQAGEIRARINRLLEPQEI